MKGTKYKTDMSFNIGHEERSKRKPDGDKKVKVKERRRSDLESDLDDARFVDDRPRPPKPKHKKRAAESAEKLRPTKKVKGAPSAPSASTALTVIPAQTAKKRISRLSKQGRESIIGQDAEDIQQMLEDGNTDSALAWINKRLLQASVDMIAQIETGIRESNGRYGVHSFNGLITSIRELMIDLQAVQDRGAIGLSMTNDIIRPSLLDIALEVMKEYQLLYDDATTMCDNVAAEPNTKRAVLNEFRQRQVESRTRIGLVIQNKYNEVRDAVVASLQR